jgi:hypothetical protein
LPPRPGQPGWALEGDQAGETGNDLMLAESRDNGRGDRVPGRCGCKGARRSRPVRPARRAPAGLRGAA